MVLGYQEAEWKDDGALHSNSASSQTTGGFKKRKKVSEMEAADKVQEDTDLMTRTSWVNAKTALNEIRKVNEQS